MELRRIDVLINKNTNQRFDINDIVKITIGHSSKREYIGRIEWIKTSQLILDMSRDYVCNTKEIEFDDITHIENYIGDD